jgi:uncharacterized repeat protein (TIGR02543 family)
MATFTFGPYATSNKYINYRIVITEGGISGRNRLCNVKVQAWRTNTGYTTDGRGTIYVNINGTDYTNSWAYQDGHAITYNSYTVFFNQDVSVPCDTAGNGTISASAYFSHSQFTSNSQGSSANVTNIGGSKIKITLNPNGGSGGTSAIWYYAGINTYYNNAACTSVITNISSPTRTGHTFVHYYGDGSAGGNNGERYIIPGGVYNGSDFASDLCTDITSNATLYALWTANTYTISYNANGGSGAPASHSYTYAASGTTNLSSEVPTRSGHTFLGWSLNSGASSASYSPGQAWGLNNASNYTLYAVWSLNTIWNDINVLNPNDVQDMLSAYFDLSYSSGYSATNLLNEPTDGNAYQVPNTVMTISNIRPYYDYYELDEVVGANHVGNGVYQHTMTENNQIVEIHMKYKSYTATFNVNGGGTVSPATITKSYGSQLGTLPTVSRTGYIFKGWYTAASGGTKISTTTILTDNVTYYAQWEEIREPQNIYIYKNGYIYARDFVISEKFYLGTDGTIYAPAFNIGNQVYLDKNGLTAVHFIKGLPANAVFITLTDKRGNALIDANNTILIAH